MKLADEIVFLSNLIRRGESIPLFYSAQTFLPVRNLPDELHFPISSLSTYRTIPGCGVLHFLAALTWNAPRLHLRYSLAVK